MHIVAVSLAIAGLCLALPVAAVGTAPGGLSDPTRPFSGGASAGTGGHRFGPVLQSTFISAVRRRAVIDGRAYRVGEQLGGSVIIDIEPYEVILRRGDRETHLRLLPGLARGMSVVKTPLPAKEGWFRAQAN